ncbi:methyltransferase domain-containing protein [Pacificimonas sp. WHA3]|uniref:Methyltransferase domain-containing protein n=1 Tax=Pacificimonas pallii TaxID=2827236 RepID=A0ABS6SGT6_9SPHN|nr:class I SAM-dependent methyltransferase [Pacificimonas pallii]MBV7257622.1 methyltransferase domain-containing protein [Pacificimonas pallii]
MTKQNNAAGQWNGRAGKAWVAMQDLMDGVLSPFLDIIVERTMIERPARVLDIGCGTGGTTVAIERAWDGAMQCVGIDISEPMIAAARQRALAAGSNAEFRIGDAGTHAFGGQKFDMMVSRFGVMFFEDFVSAFRHLRDAMAAHGSLHFCAWRDPDENPFMTTAARAAAPLVPNIPAYVPNAPGQFAFADRDFVVGLLRKAGWHGVECVPVDEALAFPARQLENYYTRLGVLGPLLPDLDEDLRRDVLTAVGAAFEPFVDGDVARANMACWSVTARA